MDKGSTWRTRSECSGEERYRTPDQDKGCIEVWMKLMDMAPKMLGVKLALPIGQSQLHAIFCPCTTFHKKVELYRVTAAWRNWTGEHEVTV